MSEWNCDMNASCIPPLNRNADSLPMLPEVDIIA